MDLLRTNNYQLEDLLNKMDVRNYAVVARNELNNALKDPNIDNIICNLTNNTHWIAINKQKKYYFDSFGQTPIPEVKDYKYNHKIIQDIKDEDCGQLCVLFLYYLNHENINKFFKLFKTRYDY